MRHHIERVIEWSDCTYHPLQGFSLGEYLPLLTMRCKVAGKNLTIVQNTKLSCETENIKSTSYFIQRIFFAEAGFSSNEI